MYQTILCIIDKTIEINSSEPEEYLGKYVAACKSGEGLKVNPELAVEFKKIFTAVLNNQLAKNTDRNESKESSVYSP